MPPWAWWMINRRSCGAAPAAPGELLEPHTGGDGADGRLICSTSATEHPGSWSMLDLQLGDDSDPAT